MSGSKNLAKMVFLEMKTSTSARMGHVGEQKPRENGFFGETEGAFQGCRNLEIEQKPHECRRK